MRKPTWRRMVRPRPASSPLNQLSAPANADECIDLGATVPDATVDFDFTEQKLTLSVPQKYMRNAARGYVPPDMWQTA